MTPRKPAATVVDDVMREADQALYQAKAEGKGVARRFDPEQFAAAEGEWATMAPSPLVARFAPISLWTGDELIVWGGHDLAGDEYVDGAAYDPITDTWRAPIVRS